MAAKEDGRVVEPWLEPLGERLQRYCTWRRPVASLRQHIDIVDTNPGKATMYNPLPYANSR